MLHTQDYTLSGWYSFVTTSIVLLLAILFVSTLLIHIAFPGNDSWAGLGLLFIPPIIFWAVLTLFLLHGVVIHNRIALLMSIFIVPLEWFEGTFTLANLASGRPDYFYHFAHHVLVLWLLYLVFLVPAILVFGQDFLKTYRK